MKKAIITGANGPLGISLIEQLVEKNIFVTAIVRPGSQRNKDIPFLKGVSVVECDLSNIFSLKNRLPDKYDAFFHFGWNTASREIVSDPFAQEPCISHTLQSVELAYHLGCKVFVGAGSWAEYGNVEEVITADTPINPRSSYGIAKFAAGKLSRQACKAFGMRHCWCRILSLYGPFDKETTAIMYCIYSLLRGQKPLLTKAEQRWDYIYSKDCARAFYLIAEKGKDGAVYPIGSGQARPLREYFEIIRDYIDSNMSLGLGDKPYPDGQVMNLCADITMLARDTGFKPEYLFDRGIHETIDWVKKALHL